MTALEVDLNHQDQKHIQHCRRSLKRKVSQRQGRNANHSLKILRYWRIHLIATPGDSKEVAIN